MKAGEEKGGMDEGRKGRREGGKDVFWSLIGKGDLPLGLER